MIQSKTQRNTMLNVNTRQSKNDELMDNLTSFGKKKQSKNSDKQNEPGLIEVIIHKNEIFEADNECKQRNKLTSLIRGFITLMLAFVGSSIAVCYSFYDVNVIGRTGRGIKAATKERYVYEDGKYYFNNKDLYNGMYHNDMKNGYGAYRYHMWGGDEWFGEWRSDVPHGQGIYTSVKHKQSFLVKGEDIANGGHWQVLAHPLTGNATYRVYHADGATYVGTFEDGRRKNGIYTWADGSWYMGTFTDDGIGYEDGIMLEDGEGTVYQKRKPL